MLVIAGHNGAGKSTFYRKYLNKTFGTHIQEHIDPDAIERAIRNDLAGESLTDRQFSELAQSEANDLRKMYSDNKISFSFETVFSDPVGDKVEFIKEAARRGYFVVLLAVGLDSPEKSMARVALRVSRNGHDVPVRRIFERYPRVLENFRKGALIASLVLVVDNSDDNPDDDGDSYRAIAIFADGKLVDSDSDAPAWCSFIS